MGTDEESAGEEQDMEGDKGEWQRATSKKGNSQSELPLSMEQQVNSPKTPKIQLDSDDVNEGIELWANSIYCYILGANPPWTVINGFAQRLWKGKGIEQVSFLPNGIFLVRFESKEAQQNALKNDAIIFDNKPVIIEEWTPQANLSKKLIKRVPIWIKLRNLELKFWGEKCFSKLVGGIGKYLESDNATKTRQFLGFAKLKVEVGLDQDFPKTIEFMDELGQDQVVGVQYDWLPITCKQCKGIGHTKEDCRKGKQGAPVEKRTWIKKTIPNPMPPAQQPEKKQIPPVTPVSKETSAAGMTLTQTREHGEGDRIDRSDTPEQGQLYQPGGVTFMDKLTLSIKKDLVNQANREAGESLLYG